ncbi:MAG: ethylbenzene dehydrogenase-related protein [Chloroflexota bacterium]
MAVLGNLFQEKQNGGKKLNPRGHALGMVSLLVALGLGMGALNVPLASSAANAVEVLHTAQAAPTDPQSPAWDGAKEIQVPLSAQQMQQPGGGSTRQVLVRAIEDGQTFAVRVSWDDSTKNDTNGAIPSDAAAVQLPIDPAHAPYQCMGQSNSRVNIWQWKAALERQGMENNALEIETAGIRNLTSNGICKAVDTPGLQPKVRSYHDGKQWHVVFYRALSKGDLTSAPLLQGSNTSVAFAVWNGANGETKGMKAVSTWNTVQFQQLDTNNAGSLVSLAIVVVVAGAAVGWAMRRMSSS